MDKTETYNVVDGSPGTNAESGNSNNESENASQSDWEILLGEPVAFAKQGKPHDGGDPEGEARDEEGRSQGEKVGEDGNGLSNDPGNDGENDDEADPSSPAHGGVDVADDGVLEHAAVYISKGNGGVDGTGDEDDGKGNSEGDLGNKWSSREKSRGLDGGANEGIAESTSQGIDGDLNESRGPNGLHVVGRGVHLVHERELADSEAEGKDDVADSDKGLGESDILLGPRRPIDGGETTIELASLDTSGDNSDANGGHNGDEIDVTKDGDLGERRRNGQDKQNDG